VAPDSVDKPPVAAFPADKLAPFLRGLLDPEGTGKLSPDQAASIDRVESNLARGEEPPRP
jgi:hypothetical protein